MSETRKTADTPVVPEWQQVDANDMIKRLRERISDLEYQADLRELQIRNLLDLLGKGGGRDKTRQ
ncbi:hypothetical protein [Bifidobacterium phasiani]|uniref:Uncharacterized protein n=1 Tax=Bifidobacterium phasiani TaxID=2834431 RepID=A0ABS6W797_9BIFI|nr:hypothetical protein [Bifidobacterium phasiani]MBW3081959.1 hypothetical protein [Bifidobacterium phasiani]